MKGREPKAPLEAFAGRRAAIGVDAEAVDVLEQLDLLPVDQEGVHIDRQPVVEQGGLDSDLIVDGRIGLVSAIERLPE